MFILSFCKCQSLQKLIGLKITKPQLIQRISLQTYYGQQRAQGNRSCQLELCFACAKPKIGSVWSSGYRMCSLCTGAPHIPAAFQYPHRSVRKLLCTSLRMSYPTPFRTPFCGLPAICCVRRETSIVWLACRSKEHNEKWKVRSCSMPRLHRGENFIPICV